MDLMKYLSHITTVPGTSGYEKQVAEEFAKLFAPFCDEVTVDGTQSMIGVKHGTGNGWQSRNNKEGGERQWPENSIRQQKKSFKK